MQRLFLPLFLLLFSCGTNNKLSDTTTVNADTTLEEQTPKTLIHKFDDVVFNTLAANISGTFDINGDVNSFNGQMRMKKDSILWLTVSKLGFEIGRLKMTSDSFAFSNRFENTVMERPLSYLQEMIGYVPSLQYVQELFSGQAQSTPAVEAKYVKTVNIDNMLFPESAEINLNKAIKLKMGYSKLEKDTELTYPFSTVGMKKI